MSKRRSIYLHSPLAAFEGHEKSIDFDGVNESMRNLSLSDLGVANAWSLMIWLKPTDTEFTVNSTIFRPVSDGDAFNAIELDHRGDLAGDPFSVALSDSSAVYFKVYRYNNLLVGAIWQQIVVTWNGTTLQLYKNASTVSPSSTPTDNTGTMTNTNRDIYIAAQAGGARWNGRMHSIALWSTALTAGNVTSIYNGGDGSSFDLSTIQGSSLQHWWKLGKAGDIGGDDGIGTAIDVNINSENITEAADAVADSPT